jgi:hypothetical protein
MNLAGSGWPINFLDSAFKATLDWLSAELKMLKANRFLAKIK